MKHAASTQPALGELGDGPCLRVGGRLETWIKKKKGSALLQLLTVSMRDHLPGLDPDLDLLCMDIMNMDQGEVLVVLDLQMEGILVGEVLAL